MREINLNEWTLFGGGASAKSYYNKTDETVMLKLFRDKTWDETADMEMKKSYAVAKLGIPTPKIIEKVSLGEQTGLIYERLQKKKSFSRLCADEPDKIGEYAVSFAKEFKKLHSIECDTNIFPSNEDMLAETLNSKMIPAEIREKAMKFMASVEKKTTCLHGDMQPGNLVKGICGSSESKNSSAPEGNYFIDLGRFSYGNPYYDLGTVYFFMVFSKKIIINQRLFHLNEKELYRFWKAFAREYFNAESENDIKEYENILKPYAALFLISITYKKDAKVNFLVRFVTNIFLSILMKGI